MDTPNKNMCKKWRMTITQMSDGQMDRDNHLFLFATLGFKRYADVFIFSLS